MLVFTPRNCRRERLSDPSQTVQFGVARAKPGSPRIKQNQQPATPITRIRHRSQRDSHCARKVRSWSTTVINLSQFSLINHLHYEQRRLCCWRYILPNSQNRCMQALLFNIYKEKLLCISCFTYIIYFSIAIWVHSIRVL